MLRGIPLPATGTFEARLLAEGIQRERNEKFAFATLLVKLAGALNISPEECTRWLAEYGEELFQFKYNSRYESVAQELEAIRQRQEDADLEKLERVERMTVE